MAGWIILVDTWRRACGRLFVDDRDAVRQLVGGSSDDRDRGVEELYYVCRMNI